MGLVLLLQFSKKLGGGDPKHCDESKALRFGLAQQEVAITCCLATRVLNLSLKEQEKVWFKGASWFRKGDQIWYEDMDI